MKFQEARQLIQTYIMESPVECTLALNDLANQVERLEAQRNELREALDFYARFILKRKSDGECVILTPIEHDCGDRARAALKATE